jgi:serine/threonine protein kinase
MSLPSDHLSDQASILSNLRHKYNQANFPVQPFFQHSTLLGRGVSADVHKVEIHDTAGVIKTFRIKNSESAAFQTLVAIDYELNILNRLSHPSVATPIGVIWDETQPQVFYPFYKSSLYSHIQSLKTSEESTLELFTLLSKQLISAVNYIHSQSIDHGDIKPANIMLAEVSPPQLVLCDFG